MRTGLLFAGCLLGLSLAHAAPPSTDTSKHDATPADTIDVDAMARAKDTKDTPAEPGAEAPAATPANTTDTATDTTGTTPVQATAPQPATQAGTAPQDTTATAPTDVSTPADDTAATAAPAPQSNATTPEPDANDKRLVQGCESRALMLLDAAEKGDYATATHDFNAKMRSALPVEKFKQAWTSLAQFGKLEARGQSHPGMAEGYSIVNVPLVFEKANLYAQVACGSDGLIAGFYVKPLDTSQP